MTIEILLYICLNIGAGAGCYVLLFVGRTRIWKRDVSTNTKAVIVLVMSFFLIGMTLVLKKSLS